MEKETTEMAATFWKMTSGLKLKPNHLQWGKSTRNKLTGIKESQKGSIIGGTGTSEHERVSKAENRRTGRSLHGKQSPRLPCPPNSPSHPFLIPSRRVQF